MTEYHIALFGNGVEAYKSFRRRGKPDDLQPLRAADVNNFIRSFFYPNTSVTNNSNSDQKEEVTEQIYHIQFQVLRASRNSFRQTYL